MGAILSDRGVLPRLRTEHMGRQDSVRSRGLDVDLLHLFFPLANSWKQIDCVLGGCAARVFGSILTLRAAMPLLRAQPAGDLLAVLDFFPDEIRARLCAFHPRRDHSFSQPSIWNCTFGGPSRVEPDLQTFCSATPLVLGCRACRRALNDAVAGLCVIFLKRV